jgi:hypothetical protein
MTLKSPVSGLREAVIRVATINPGPASKALEAQGVHGARVLARIARQGVAFSGRQSGSAGDARPSVVRVLRRQPVCLGTFMGNSSEMAR